MTKKDLSQIIDLVETFQTVLCSPRDSGKKCIFGSLEVLGTKLVRKIGKKKVFETNQAERSGFSESPGRETPGPKI